MHVKLLDAAKADLREAYRYIAQKNPAAALKIATKIRKHVLALGLTPLAYSEYSPGIRRMVVHGSRYVVFYRVREFVEVIEIRHTARAEAVQHELEVRK